MTRPTTRETSPATLFARAIKGKNFMTPTVIEIEWTGGKRHVYELSEGTGLDGSDIYGVTVVRVEGNSCEHEKEMSQMFGSKSEARKYIRSLS